MASKSKTTKAKNTAASKPSLKKTAAATKPASSRSAVASSKKAIARKKEISSVAARREGAKTSGAKQKGSRPAPDPTKGTLKKAGHKADSGKPSPQKNAAPLWRAFSPSASPALPARAQLAVDRSEIADVIYSAARALDRLDETLLRSVFHADATLDLGPGLFQGSSAEFIPWIFGALNEVKSSHHLIGNVLAQVEGDVASVESYAQTHFRLDKPTGREDLFVGSRLLDRFERRPSGPSGVWKIVHRKEILDWARTGPVSDFFYHQNPDALWSSRSNEDPSYFISKFPGSQSGAKMPSFLGRRFESKSIKF